jgi:site-specific DNA recombinase
MNRSSARRAPVPAVRCAIYTRKSTEEGLEQEFNSLDAQRESGEAFIKSQAHEGWTILAARYDDGGFTGGNMDRPALRRLLGDIEAGNIDCVVVYKVDRLSRSLLDFARMMESFERHQVAFVSVTQQFNTATSMGRLVLNVLLSFAQFEREIISERTRDKIAAARRKGKWSGGHPILGYDVDANKKLLVNSDEAVRVRAIFDLYLQHESLLAVVQELARRGWVNKRWTTRKGHERGGQPFTTTNLYRLLTNVAYIGRVRYKQESHAGEHEGIVDHQVWQRVQILLQRNGRTGGAVVRNRFGAVLKGLLHCVPCGCAMTPSHCTKNGTTRYRYYVCTKAQKRGWKACPSPSIPAAEIERFVVDQIRCIGKDPGLLREIIAQAQFQVRSRLEELEAERRSLAREVAGWNAEVRRCAEQTTTRRETAAVGRLADLHDRLGTGERRLREIRDEAEPLKREVIDEGEVARALAAFDPVWDALTPHEQAHVIGLLVERVDYDGRQGKVSITFHTAGIQTLADELARPLQEMIA